MAPAGRELRYRVELRFLSARSRAAEQVAAALGRDARLEFLAGPAAASRDEPLLRARRIDGRTVELSVYSPTTNRRVLADEARAWRDLAVSVIGARRGVFVDCLAMRECDFADCRKASGRLSDLYSIHAVAMPWGVHLHTHGLSKLACPDVEWCLDESADPRVAAAVLRRVVEHATASGCTFRPGDTLALEGSNARLRVEALTERVADYAGNDLLRFAAATGSPAHAARESSRGGYFHGYAY